MPGDDKSEPPLTPPTMEGLAAMMTKLLSSMGDMETRFTSMESRITSMESRLQPPPTSTPAASMPYGMLGYGSTTLASSSSTAAATLSTAPPTSSPTSSALLLRDAGVWIYLAGEPFLHGRRHHGHGRLSVVHRPQPRARFRCRCATPKGKSASCSDCSIIHQGSVRRHKGYNSPDTSRSPGDDTT